MWNFFKKRIYLMEGMPRPHTLDSLIQNFPYLPWNEQLFFLQFHVGWIGVEQLLQLELVWGPLEMRAVKKRKKRLWVWLPKQRGHHCWFQVITES